MNTKELQTLSKLIRYHILTSTTNAGSGHPTSSLSATDLMTALLFGGYFKFDLEHPENPGNDRLIFSKGHASPLYYSLFLAAGAITLEEMKGYRKFDSVLEGHPTPRFRFTEAATGSLGQGLSVGVGMALALRAEFPISNFQFPISNKTIDSKNKNPSPITHHPSPTVYVLLGDGEMAEGSTWEAINIASHYQLDNLVAIVDVNRLGQSQETMLGWNTETYERRFQAFGWNTIVIDGHNYDEIQKAYEVAVRFRHSRAGGNPYIGLNINKITKGVDPRILEDDKGGKPYAIIAKTVKGKGVSFLENKDGWHGKPLPREQLDQALKELGEIDLHIRGKVEKPASRGISNFKFQISNKFQNSKSQFSKLITHHPSPITYKKGDQIATRKAYGTSLTRLGEAYPNVVVLDAEVKNSTYAEIFKEKFPDRYYEMFIAEQNMVGTGVGFARRGFIPFVSSFACFLARGFDQIRMAALSQANVKFCGSHAGVSIGEDGPSQMALEDIAMFRAIHDSVVLYPSDAVSTEKLVEEMIKRDGICYMRTSRPTTPVIYGNDEQFPIGGSKVHPSPITHHPSQKKIIIIAAGVTLFESLKAREELAKEGIAATVVDCYSIKPIDADTLRHLVYPNSHKPITHLPAEASAKAGHPSPVTNVITVEDHWFEGGLGDAVLNVFAENPKVKVHKLSVIQMPRSGKPSELLEYEGISSRAIIEKVKQLLH